MTALSSSVNSLGFGPSIVVANRITRRNGKFRLKAILNEAFFTEAFQSVERAKIDPLVSLVKKKTEGTVEASSLLMKVESSETSKDWSSANNNYEVKWDFVKEKWVSSPTNGLSVTDIEETFCEVEENSPIKSPSDSEELSKEWKSRFGDLSKLAALYGKESQNFVKGTLAALTEAKASEKLVGLGLGVDQLAEYAFAAQRASSVLAAVSKVTSKSEYIRGTTLEQKTKDRDSLKRFMKNNFGNDVLILTLNIADLPSGTSRKLQSSFILQPTEAKKRKLLTILDDWKSELLEECATNPEEFNFSKSTGKF
jgi:hypothetical protein